MSAWQAVPVSVSTAPASGGRWTSLAAGGREWLWSNPDPEVRRARTTARPGDAFADAGGGEECFPTVQGVPDHGELWTLPWHRSASGETVEVGNRRVTRRVRARDGDLCVAYRIAGRPGTRFVHAVHLLLDLSPLSLLEIPGRPALTWRDAAGPGEHMIGRWPVVDGTDFSRLGPDDGTAACLVVHDVTSCRIVDGSDALTLSWRRTRGDGPGEGLVLWRNLRGWPADRPYRSIGIEPCLGATVDHEETGLCSATDATGTAEWELVIAGRRRRPAG